MAEDWMVERDGRGDTELTDAYRNGDETAAAELYRRYYLKLLHGVATKLPSKEIAEDCVGEAFLNVLEIIRRGSGPTSNFYGYLRSAVVRESAKYFRDREIGPTLDEATEEGARQLAVDDDVSHIEESLLQPALRSLPKKWRDIVTLRYVENLKPAQIATMLDTEAPALHKMLYRAKNGLRDEYLKQIALSRSSTRCREFSNDLAALATSGENRCRVVDLKCTCWPAPSARRHWPRLSISLVE
ncbi:sigma-70 family RNA polymerase sigma factor [Leucobacter coleopterorum]|uniref:Sigma-70 family RNA polymerase sigma factor n=1 Tax=Leucobacter coleopterorum TaxID=2714933 RepID=A0ABX6K387_9MICO|nr:sigma-70 family RNA polymerase sigma factor [Leucobacter coleopterorum]QIM19505.1 sigma-70 family RNA polymerase sigma factor [Leucobacter coleopterorum]